VAVKHLNDREIQDYLDGNITDERSDIIAHLGTCELCLKRLGEYEALSEGLKADFTPVLSDSFAKSVIARIQSESKLASRLSVRSVLIPLLGALCGLGALILSIYFTPFLNSFKIGKLGRHLVEMIIAGTEKLAGSLDIDLTVIVSVGLILLSVGIVDFIIRRYKHKQITFLV